MPNAIDPVNSPPHYNSGEIECIDAIESALGVEGFHDYLRGNILKYLWRMQHKHDEPLHDLLKAQWYLNRLISSVDKEAKLTTF